MLIIWLPEAWDSIDPGSSLQIEIYIYNNDAACHINSSHTGGSLEDLKKTNKNTPNVSCGTVALIVLGQLSDICGP